MNTSEFKAWFDGFAETIGRNDLPTPAQWKRIHEEIKKLTPEVKTVTLTPRGPLPDVYPRLWYTRPEPTGPAWKQPEIICKAQTDFPTSNLSAQAYSFTVDALSKNGTANPEDGLKG